MEIKKHIGRKLSAEEVKEKQIGLMEQLHEFCQKNGLRYSMSGGTFLGAVRHKGFIPWDDDVDMFMPRPDYERFKQLYNEQMKDSYIMNYNTEPTYYKIFTRIFDKNTVMVQRGKILGGVFIDVFAVDGQPSDYDEFYAYWREEVRLRKLIHKSTPYWKNSVNIFYKALFWLMSRKPERVRQESIDSLEAMLRKYPFETSEYAGAIIGGSGPGTHIKKENFEHYADYDFEGRKFKGLKDYDTYLSKMYGDYMTLPPVSQQKGHHSATWYEKI